MSSDPDPGQGLAKETCDPTVSVIIPTFNRAVFIGEAIESVLKQSYRDFELIVVNDGSTDSTADIVNSFTDGRLIFLDQENKGRSAARNRAIALARGKYVAFLDSDDVYLEDKLKLQVDYIQSHPDVGMIYTSAVCMDENGNPLTHYYDAFAEGMIYKQVAFFQPVTITLPTVMVRREVIDSVGGFDEKMERFEDTDLWRRITKRYKVGALKEPTCRLRTHRENDLHSQDPLKIIAAIEYYVAKIFDDDIDMGVEYLNQGASLLCEYYGYALLTVPGWRKYGVSLLIKSFRHSPRRGVGKVKARLARLLHPYIMWLRKKIKALE